MENKENCIVITSFYPHKQKVSVITQTMGKINLVCPSLQIAKIRPGMALACTPERLNETTYSARTIDLIYAPEFGDKQDFYCFHHLAELCYYAVPLANPCSDIFNYLKRCLALLQVASSQGHHEQRHIHALMVAQLLVFIGFYPHEEKHSSLFIDFAKASTIDCLRACVERYKKTHYHIDAWIMECLQQHPSYKLFKTLPFMYAHTSFSSSKEKP